MWGEILATFFQNRNNCTKNRKPNYVHVYCKYNWKQLHFCKLEYHSLEFRTPFDLRNQFFFVRVEFCQKLQFVRNIFWSKFNPLTRLQNMFVPSFTRFNLSKNNRKLGLFFVWFHNHELLFLSLTSRSLSVNKWAPPGCAMCLSRNFMSCLLFWTLLLSMSSSIFSLFLSGVTSSGASCHIICLLISELFWICPFLAWVWQHWTGNTIQAEAAGLIEVSGAEFGGLRRGWKGCCTVCWNK